MLFNTVQFAVFLLAVLTAHYVLPRSTRKWMLLGASYYFYMCWNPKFIVLLLALTAIDFAAGLWIARSAGGRRKMALIFSLCANLGFLGFFKYFNFLAGTVSQFTLDIVLPIGISFHTFQSMSYVIDVYRGEQEPVTNPVDYALFIAFFPQLVAGPIVRARNFFQDLHHWQPPTTLLVQRGILLVLFGLAKKMVAADHFAQLSDAYFQNVATHPGMLTAWGGTIAFAMQIFFDFSGYTDIAIGCAALLGFHFPENFRRPYLAASVTEFWRRWHISLSTWLRDYLYIPLGGNRGGAARTYRNLMLTMLLGGLWHGASWNFVIWGGYHGALLSGERLLGVGVARFKWLHPLRVVLTFGLVSIGWVFFRAANFPDACFVLKEMIGGVRGEFPWTAWYALPVLAILEERWGWVDRLAQARWWAFGPAVAAILLAIELFGVTDVAIPFIYFQF